jgi:uncharacterized protein YcnI
MRALQLSSLLLLAVVAVITTAHVTVQPREVVSKKGGIFTVSVPTEKPVPTIKLRLEFPDGMRVSRLRAKQGWTAEVERDTSNAIRIVTWSGGKIAPDEYDEFAFNARVSAPPSQLAIKAFQTYEGGDVVEWTNLSTDPKAEHPAPKITITPEQSRFGSIARDNWLAGAALLLGLVTLTMTMRNGGR